MSGADSILNPVDATSQPEIQDPSDNTLITEVKDLGVKIDLKNPTQYFDITKGFGKGEKARWWEKQGGKFKIGLIRNKDLDIAITIFTESFDFSKKSKKSLELRKFDAVGCKYEGLPEDVSEEERAAANIDTSGNPSNTSPQPNTSADTGTKTEVSQGFNTTNTRPVTEIDDSLATVGSASDFERLYLGWIADDESLTKDDISVIKNVMKSIFRFIFGTRNVSQATQEGRFHIALRAAYTHFEANEKLPCKAKGSNIWEEFKKSIHFRRELALCEMFAARQVIGENTQYVTLKKELIMGLNTVLDALDTSPYCFQYGDTLEPVPEPNGDISDEEYTRILRIFEQFVRVKKLDKTKSIDLRKALSDKSLGLRQGKDYRQVYQKLLRHLQWEMDAEAYRAAIAKILGEEDPSGNIPGTDIERLRLVILRLKERIAELEAKKAGVTVDTQTPSVPPKETADAQTGTPPTPAKMDAKTGNSAPKTTSSTSTQTPAEIQAELDAARKRLAELEEELAELEDDRSDLMKVVETLTTTLQNATRTHKLMMELKDLQFELRECCRQREEKESASASTQATPGGTSTETQTTPGMANAGSQGGPGVEAEKELRARAEDLEEQIRILNQQLILWIQRYKNLDATSSNEKDELQQTIQDLELKISQYTIQYNILLSQLQGKTQKEKELEAKISQAEEQIRILNQQNILWITRYRQLQKTSSDELERHKAFVLRVTVFLNKKRDEDTILATDLESIEKAIKDCCKEAEEAGKITAEAGTQTLVNPVTPEMVEALEQKIRVLLLLIKDYQRRLKECQDKNGENEIRIAELEALLAAAEEDLKKCLEKPVTSSEETQTEEPPAPPPAPEPEAPAAAPEAPAPEPEAPAAAPEAPAPEPEAPAPAPAAAAAAPLISQEEEQEQIDEAANDINAAIEDIKKEICPPSQQQQSPVRSAQQERKALKEKENIFICSKKTIRVLKKFYVQTLAQVSQYETIKIPGINHNYIETFLEYTPIVYKKKTIKTSEEFWTEKNEEGYIYDLFDIDEEKAMTKFITRRDHLLEAIFQLYVYIFQEGLAANLKAASKRGYTGDDVYIHIRTEFEEQPITLLREQELIVYIMKYFDISNKLNYSLQGISIPLKVKTTDKLCKALLSYIIRKVSYELNEKSRIQLDELEEEAKQLAAPASSVPAPASPVKTTKPLEGMARLQEVMEESRAPGKGQQQKGGSNNTILKAMQTMILLKSKESPEDLLAKAEATIDDMGQRDLVLPLLTQLLDAALDSDNSSYSAFTMDDTHTDPLEHLEKAYSSHFTEEDTAAFSSFTNEPYSFHANTPEEFEEVLGRNSYINNANSSSVKNMDEEYDIELADEEKAALEKGGIPLGALIFLYTVASE